MSTETEHHWEECPDEPCEFCTGCSTLWVGEGKERRRQTSWEWCKEMNTCAATVDWDKIYGYE